MILSIEDKIKIKTMIKLDKFLILIMDKFNIFKSFSYKQKIMKNKFTRRIILICFVWIGLKLIK